MLVIRVEVGATGRVAEVDNGERDDERDEYEWGYDELCGASKWLRCGECKRDVDLR